MMYKLTPSNRIHHLSIKKIECKGPQLLPPLFYHYLEYFNIIWDTCHKKMGVRHYQKIGVRHQ